MSIKMKMGTGILAGALGLSLVGGGTWAAFNDVETTSNTFAAGTLDLVVGSTSTMNFTIANLKPGDYFTKQLVLKNNGSLDINQIKVHGKKLDGWKNEDIIKLNEKVGAGSGDNNEDDFLSQFKITIKKQGAATPVYDGFLNNLVAGTGVGELTGTDANTVGLATGAADAVYDVRVEFVKNDTTFNGSRLHVQNKYQGEKSNLEFVFEATQMPGENRSNN
jgi:spore coat-associated protein N